MPWVPEAAPSRPERLIRQKVYLSKKQRCQEDFRSWLVLEDCYSQKKKKKPGKKTTFPLTGEERNKCGSHHTVEHTHPPVCITPTSPREAERERPHTEEEPNSASFRSRSVHTAHVWPDSKNRRGFSEFRTAAAPKRDVTGEGGRLRPGAPHTPPACTEPLTAKGLGRTFIHQTRPQDRWVPPGTPGSPHCWTRLMR